MALTRFSTRSPWWPPTTATARPCSPISRRGEPAARPSRRGRSTTGSTNITVDHVLASSAIPALFAPVQIDGRWYIDGGVRLNVPLKPAIALEATELVVVATHPATYPAGARHAARPAARRRGWDRGHPRSGARRPDGRGPPHAGEDQRARGAGPERANHLLIPYVFVGPHTRHQLGDLAAAVYRERFRGLNAAARAGPVAARASDRSARASRRRSPQLPVLRPELHRGGDRARDRARHRGDRRTRLRGRTDAVELLRGALGAEPALEVALAATLLSAVAAGERGPLLRIYRPPPTVAFGRRDAFLPGFAPAICGDRTARVRAGAARPGRPRRRLRRRLSDRGRGDARDRLDVAGSRSASRLRRERYAAGAARPRRRRRVSARFPASTAPARSPSTPAASASWSALRSGSCAAPG